MSQLETVNIFKTEKGYVQQNKLEEKDLKKIAEKISDRFMIHFHFQRQKNG
ncbi:MAG: hypothetical protein HFH60_00450 [Lachnospiraceae bacterium]|nr:hypothetical protein [Lachnospiraceae bacterium]